MRHTMPAVLLALAVTSSVATADSAADSAAEAAADLAPGEVREHLKAVDAAIAQCYLGAVGDRAGAGHLDITLSIHRKGIVDRVDVKTPGLPAKLATKIDTCVRAALVGVTFPTRRLGTTAVVPYFWQKTAARDAGPQESCWNANGCKTTNDAAAATATAPSKARGVTTGRQARRAPRS